MQLNGCTGFSASTLYHNHNHNHTEMHKQKQAYLYKKQSPNTDVLKVGLNLLVVLSSAWLRQTNL